MSLSFTVEMYVIAIPSIICDTHQLLYILTPIQARACKFEMQKYK